MTKNENNIHVHNNLKYEDFNNDNLNNFKPDIIICQGIINNIIFDFKNQNKNIQLIYGNNMMSTLTLLKMNLIKLLKQI